MDQILEIVNRLAEDIATPRALAVKLLANAGEWSQLQQLRCKPSDYLCSESYWRDSVITDLLRKAEVPTQVDKKGVAVQTFLACERQNAATNVRLARYLHQTPLEIEDLGVLDFIGLWRKDIALVLGNLPDTLTPRFSPGSTYDDTGVYITTPDKMSNTPTIYDESVDLVPLWDTTSWKRALCEEFPHRSNPRRVRGNLFFTVPKDGLTDRGCCKEASINISYQLDVGRIMKSRLKRIGIDLRHDQFYHRKLAQQASRDGRRATIDMSNASDTLCRVLPKLTLPGAWWELLNSLRAPMTRVQGKWYRLEKFSSMGNGFTFELETLLFATLARVVVTSEGGDPDMVQCYGDDLIVPSEHAKSCVLALRMFGFTPNIKKTFLEGPFRESCGGDFWLGVPVRAHFIKELPNEPQQWISLANGLRRVALSHDCSVPRWNIVSRAWKRCLAFIPSDIRRCTGPEHLGDVVIHTPERSWLPHRSHTRESMRRLGLKPKPCKDWDPSWGSDFIAAYVPVPKVLPWHHWKPSVQLASCTLGYPSLGITPRGSVSGYRISWVNATLTSDWEPRT